MSDDRLFHLVTEWSFDAPVDAVWTRLTDPSTFPEWWPGFETARVSGDGGIGTRSYFRVRSDFGLRFNLVTRIEEIHEPQYIRLSSIGGLEGTGVWLLESNGDSTDVKYVWNVDPTNRFLRVLGRIPLLRARMERSHDGVMEAGGRNLARLLAEDIASRGQDVSQ